eukprot:1464427-Amphidinium_carterae.1
MFPRRSLLLRCVANIQPPHACKASRDSAYDYHEQGYVHSLWPNHYTLKVSPFIQFSSEHAPTPNVIY